MRILIVDDDTTNRLVVRLLMELRGFDVLEANGGREAERVLKQEQVDAVFMDINMPEIDGYESTRILRAGVLEDHVPVFALTSGTSEDARQECIKSGMNGFIKKPFEATMAERIHSIMENRGKGAMAGSGNWMIG